MSAIRTFNAQESSCLHIHSGLPTLDEARRLVIEEIKQAKRGGVKLLRVRENSHMGETPHG